MSKYAIEASDCVILFADLQAGIVELSKTNPVPRLQNAVLGLAKLARLLEIPVLVTGVAGEDGSPAKVLAQIGEGAGEKPTHHRTTCDSFGNPEIAAAIRATGRKTLLLSGVATEVAVQLAALSAVDAGMSVYVVLDACGGVTERTEQAALARMQAAGVAATSVITLAGEMAGDFREPRAQQMVQILFQMAQNG